MTFLQQQQKRTLEQRRRVVAWGWARTDYTTLLKLGYGRAPTSGWAGLVWSGAGGGSDWFHVIDNLYLYFVLPCPTYYTYLCDDCIHLHRTTTTQQPLAEFHYGDILLLLLLLAHWKQKHFRYVSPLELLGVFSPCALHSGIHGALVLGACVVSTTPTTTLRVKYF